MTELEMLRDRLETQQEEHRRLYDEWRYAQGIANAAQYTANVAWLSVVQTEALIETLEAEAADGS